jgi:hypothetical protein
MSFLVQDGQTVVFIGDSITDCGRRDVAAPLGNGYVKFIADLICHSLSRYEGQHREQRDKRQHRCRLEGAMA